MKDRKFSVVEKVIEALEDWFPEQEKALQFYCSKYVQLGGEYVEKYFLLKTLWL